jgi:diadenosine tetraphosphate (Ap4A) HIT family hydrolase
MFHSSRIKFQARSLQDRLRVEDCWFCKTNADRSLIVWEGRYLYISLEKGPLCRFHLQIIPFNHSLCSTQLDVQEQEELNKIKTRLESHFADQEYQTICYERYLPLSEAVNHCVVHLLPVKRPQSLSRSFEQLNKDDGLRFREWKGERRGNQFFLDLQVGGKHYIREVQRKERVQADYMRQLIC